MNKIKVAGIVLTLCLTVAAGARAQELEQKLSNFTETNAPGFLQPLADAFGANLNSALYHSAKIKTFGLNVYVGFETVAALISDDQKTFMAKTEPPFSPQLEVRAPTVFGSEDGVTITGAGGSQISFPGGFDMSVLPVAVLQVYVGSFLGTEAMGRFLQFNLGEDLGDLNLIGFGVRHSISQYIPLLPVNIAASAFRQHFELGDIINADATLLGIQASLGAGPLEIYSGVAYEKVDLDIAYEFGVGTAQRRIEFELESENSSRITLGASFTLAIINLHADYNFGAQDVISLGAGLQF